MILNGPEHIFVPSHMVFHESFKFENPNRRQIELKEGVPEYKTRQHQLKQEIMQVKRGFPNRLPKYLFDEKVHVIFYDNWKFKVLEIEK